MFLAYFLHYNRYINILGIGVILFIAWLFSFKRSRINVRLVGNGLALQLALGFVMIKTTVGQTIINTIAHYVNKLYEFADVGSSFMFGSLTNHNNAWGFIFAFKVLPIIIFFGAFMAVLFHIGFVQLLVSSLSAIFRPILRTSGAETLCAIANSFLGQTEAPLLIRNYLPSMTKSEILVVMVSGMATISGSILIMFASMGVPVEHLLASSIMAIPASLIIAKILYPETELSETAKQVRVAPHKTAHNLFEAIATGTTDGLHLAVNVGAMLISFLALLALADYALESFSVWCNYLLDSLQVSWHMPLLTINRILSWLFAPFGYLLGFRGQEALHAGQLIGTKIAINELIAYKELVRLGLSERSTAILTYALCGFSNFSCIGIQLGGIGALIPEKRAWLAQFGLYAVLGGALSNLLSAMIVGLLL